MLDGIGPLPLVCERGADLAVQLGDVLGVSASHLVREPVLPDGDGRVDASQAQRDVTLLLLDSRPALRIAMVERGGHLVVDERLLVGVQGARRVAGGLDELERLGAQRRELLGGEPHFRTERRRAAVVLRKQRHHLVTALARAAFDEHAHLEVLARAHRLGQHRVGDVADQHVLEGELLLVGEAAAIAGNDQVLVAQRRQRRLQLPSVSCGDRGQHTLPEGASNDRRVRDQLALERLERVQARGQQPLHRVRELGRAGRSFLGEALHHLLGEQRVPFGALGERFQHI